MNLKAEDKDAEVEAKKKNEEFIPKHDGINIT